MRLDDILESIAHTATAYPIADGEQGVSYQSSPDPAFVAPPIRVVETDETPEGLGQPHILLISAPAATGKTAAGRQIASQCRSPLLDLSQLQVGAGTLAGQLVNALGYSEGARLIADLQGGHASVVVDAMDEAELRSGDRNFLAFLMDLGRFARTVAGDKIALITLARSETAAWIRVSMDEEGVPITHVELDFFDHADACQFIDGKLTLWYSSESRPERHKTAPVPFADCRDAIFQQIYDLFGSNENPWDNPDLRRFLGYAPVLVAIAQFLFVDNHFSLHGEIEAESAKGGRASQWTLLTSLVHDLLLREQEKFANQVWPNLEPELSAPWPGGRSVIYSPEEQCARLIARVEQGALVADLPLALPEELRANYEDAVAAFLPNHPFLAAPRRLVGTVFRDYLFAQALTGRTLRASDAALVRGHMLSTDYLPTPLLAGFLLALTGDSSGLNASVAAVDAGFFVESLTATMRSNDGYFVAASGSKDDGVSLGVLTWREGSEGGGGSFASIQVDLTDLADGIRFPARLAYASVLVNCLVQLGGRGDTVTIGPDVGLACDELIIISTEVRAMKGDSPIRIKAESFLASPGVKLTTFGRGDLYVDWPDVEYPWHEHRRGLIPPGGRQDYELVLQAAFTEFRRILTRFRGRQGDLLFCYKPFMDKFILAGNPVAEGVMERMLSRRLVSMDGPDFYVLDISTLAAAKIGYVEVRKGVRSDEIMAFVRDLIADN